MTHDLITALALFALVSSITPGPNNLMLMASGANFGLRRTLPHMFGVGIGFVFMILMVGMGLAQVFDIWPTSRTVLRAISVVYLLYLAWRIATAAPPAEAADAGRTFTFLQAAAFQWVNPKAWAMALTAVSAYAPGRQLWDILLLAAIFGLINLPSTASWTVLGQQMRRILVNPARLRAFNWGMAGVLVVSIWPVIAPT